MPNYVVLTDAVEREAVHTTTTAVVCGSAAKVREVVGISALTGTHCTFLTTGSEIREYADRHAAPEVCVIVTPLPDGPAVPLIRMLRARGWQKVVVLSGKADARAIHSTLTSGVRSVIVHREPELAAVQSPPAGAAVLSERELEVLRMVADGQTNRTVGEHLGLSGLTVKSHLARIARKLGCGDRAEMVATAIRNGYIA
jgi:DNA-binding NarL/FixJ family response regulator